MFAKLRWLVAGTYKKKPSFDGRGDFTILVTL
jgi:hypothetical protein